MVHYYCRRGFFIMISYTCKVLLVIHIGIPMYFSAAPIAQWIHLRSENEDAAGGYG